jgi:hypothetical protein
MERSNIGYFASDTWASRGISCEVRVGVYITTKIIPQDINMNLKGRNRCWAWLGSELLATLSMGRSLYRREGLKWAQNDI